MKQLFKNFIRIQVVVLGDIFMYNQVEATVRRVERDGRGYLRDS